MYMSSNDNNVTTFILKKQISAKQSLDTKCSTKT